MARMQFPHMSSALTASFSVRQPPNEPFVLSSQSTAPRLPCGGRKRCQNSVLLCSSSYYRFQRSPYLLHPPSLRPPNTFLSIFKQCTNRGPSLNALNDSFSMDDIQSTNKLLTFAPNTTIFTSLPSLSVSNIELLKRNVWSYFRKVSYF